MAKRNSKRYVRRHVSPRTGAVGFTTTVRVVGFKSITKTFPTKAATLDWADATEQMLREQKARGGVRADVGSLTVGDVLAEYLRDAETAKLRSYATTDQTAGWWIENHGATKALDFNVIKLRAARDGLARKLKPGTVNRYLITMRSAWNWARRSGLVPEDRRWPERLLLSEPPGRTRHLSDAEMKALLDAARAHSLTMYAAIVVSLACGLRKGELLRLNWQDIDLTRQIVKVKFTKNDQPRQVHLTAAACEALRALQGKVRAIGALPVFTGKGAGRLLKSTCEARWHRIRTAAGLVNFHWHDLRHTTASVLAQNGASLVQIAEVLGHKALASTWRYSHLTQGAALPQHAVLDSKLKQP
jgi:integrase